MNMAAAFIEEFVVNLHFIVFKFSDYTFLINPQCVPNPYLPLNSQTSFCLWQKEIILITWPICFWFLPDSYLNRLLLCC